MLVAEKTLFEKHIIADEEFVRHVPSTSCVCEPETEYNDKNVFYHNLLVKHKKEPHYREYLVRNGVIIV